MHVTSRWQAFLRPLLAVGPLLVLFVLLPLPAQAESEEPAPPILPGERVEDGVFTIALMGDSLAEGIWGALYRALQRDPRFDIVDYSKNSSGLARQGYFDWPGTVDAAIAEDPIDAVVFSVGLNDGLPIDLEDGTRLSYRSEAWDIEYQRRIDTIMTTLLDANVPCFWVGLPIMRSSKRSEAAAHLNVFFEQLAVEHGFPYISTWDLTVDENGEYASHLPDENGRKRLMRANDGIHFTGRGYDMLGRAVIAVLAQQQPVFQADNSQ